MCHVRSGGCRVEVSLARHAGADDGSLSPASQLLPARTTRSHLRRAVNALSGEYWSTMYAGDVADVRLGVGRSCVAVDHLERIRAETVRNGLR